MDRIRRSTNVRLSIKPHSLTDPNELDMSRKASQIPAARSIFQTTLKTRSLTLDYPLMIFDAYASFESLYGSVREQEESRLVLGKARDGVERKEARERKEAERVYWEAYRASVAVAAAAADSTERVVDGPNGVDGVVGMHVDSPSHPNGTAGGGGGGGGTKRKADDMEDTLSITGGGGGNQNKKPKMEKEVVLKRYLPLSFHFADRDADVLISRDRENCTVFVSNLPPAASESDLQRLFKDVRPPPSSFV